VRSFFATAALFVAVSETDKFLTKALGLEDWLCTPRSL
jgi:hypothetical protein